MRDVPVRPPYSCKREIPRGCVKSAVRELLQGCKVNCWRPANRRVWVVSCPFVLTFFLPDNITQPAFIGGLQHAFVLALSTMWERTSSSCCATNAIFSWAQLFEPKCAMLPALIPFLIHFHLTLVLVLECASIYSLLFLPYRVHCKENSLQIHRMVYNQK